MTTTGRPSRRESRLSPAAKRGLVPLLAAGVVCLAADGTTQPASMVLRLDNAQLVSRSDVVLSGTVTAVTSAGATSEATVAVECSLKGAPGKSVTVVFSPGQSESPVLERGEIVLLFLTKLGAGRYQTTGGQQGRFTLAAAGTPRAPDRPPAP